MTKVKEGTERTINATSKSTTKSTGLGMPTNNTSATEGKQLQQMVAGDRGKIMRVDEYTSRLL